MHLAFAKCAAELSMYFRKALLLGACKNCPVHLNAAQVML